MNDPDNTEQEASPQASILSSLMFVVDMMNNGDVDPKEVYPEGRYQGD